MPILAIAAAPFALSAVAAAFTTTAATTVATAAFTTTATTVAATATATAIATAAFTTAATVAATTATAVATAARGTRFHGARFVDDQVAAAHRLAVHAGNGSLRLGVTAHLDKTETLGAAGVALHHDLGTGDGAELAEGLLQVSIARGIGQVAHV